MNSFDCIVVGGGLVGAAIAYGLSGRGLKTAVLDEGDVAYRASRGNFGLVWVQGKGQGRPEYARWSRFASEIWSDFAAELHDLTGVDVAYTRQGGVIVALSEEELDAVVRQLQGIRQEVGADYDFEIMDHARLAKRLPGLGPEVPGGTYCPFDGHVNPLRLLRALHAGNHHRGVRYFDNHSVKHIEAGDAGGFRIRAGDATFEADKIVLAAGLGNRPLGAMVGLNIPVTPLQGQILVTERTQPLFDHPTNIVRQTNEGSFLLGFSQDDLGFETATQTETLRDIAWRCAKAFPFLGNLRIVRSWAALRVMTPDGFPVYDQSEPYPGAYVVTCHSGVTLAANHALHVAGWIADGTIPTTFDCFRTRRFDVQTAASA